MDETGQAYQLDANAEVVGFMELQVHPKVNGRQMLQELLKVYPAGILTVFNGIRIRPKNIAEQIRNEDVHAVYFHPLKKRWFFASKLHKEVAEARLGNP